MPCIRELGTLDDFRRLMAACAASTAWKSRSISRCNARPTIPGSSEHPEWFKRRPDGTIQYAENPPKKYEDIVNPDFNCADGDALWHALRDVVLFWVAQGVRIFRVDNPHTKPLPFWEWLIREVQSAIPTSIFLSEAFTRPKLMKALAKLGFTPVVHVFHLAHRPRTSCRTISPRSPAIRSANISGRISSSTRPTSCPFHLQSGEPLDVQVARRARRDAVGRTTASTTASS